MQTLPIPTLNVSFYRFYHQTYVWQISIQLLSIEKGINETIKRVVVLFKRLLNFKPTETNFKALKALKREPARDFRKTKVFQVALETFELEKFANI